MQTQISQNICYNSVAFQRTVYTYEGVFAKNLHLDCRAG